MSIALSTIIILYLFVLPYWAMWKTYYSGYLSSQQMPTHNAIILIVGIAPSIVYQVGFYLFATWVFPTWSIDFVGLGTLLVGNLSTIDSSGIFKLIDVSLWGLFSYALVFWSILLSSVFFFRFLIRKYRLDTKYSIGNLKNKYFYILTGEFLDWPGFRGTSKDFDFIWVDVASCIGSHSVLYKGMLADFILDSKEGINALLLTDASKRVLFPTSQEDSNNQKTNTTAICQYSDQGYLNPDENQELADMDGFSKIRGDVFIIPGENILNLNLSFIQISIDGFEEIADFLDELNDPKK